MEVLQLYTPHNGYKFEKKKRKENIISMIKVERNPPIYFLNIVKKKSVENRHLN